MPVPLVSVVFAGKDRRGVAAGEVDRASIARYSVVVGVFRRHGEIECDAGRALAGR